MTQHAIRETPAAGLDGFVCCRVGAEQYAIRGADVQNVARADRISPGPDGRGRVGTLRDGRRDVPVYSLAELFGRKRPSRFAEGHVVIAGDEQEPFGLVVDRIARAASQHAEVLPLPGFAGRRAASWFEGLLRLEDTACLVIVPEGLDPRTSGGPAARASRRAAVPGGPAEFVPPSDIVVTFGTAALPPAGTTRYALSGQRVAALVQSLPSIPLPGRSPYVKELGWWQNAAVPVLDFSEGQSRAANGSTRFLVARCGSTAGGAFVAFRVDADVLLRRATDADAQVVGRDGLPFLRGIFKVSGECVALLDLDALTRGVAAATALVVSRVPVLT